MSERQIHNPCVGRGALFAVFLASSLWMMTSRVCPAVPEAALAAAIEVRCAALDEANQGDSGPQWNAWHQLPATIHESPSRPSAIRDITSALPRGMETPSAAGPLVPLPAHADAGSTPPAVNFPLLI
ncbi:MAG TPA: hypothetical protein VFV95_03355 [Vicinamibacterales bacterium]|nr:hypothetical protein [Vicinamibacterales bacterium]